MWLFGPGQRLSLLAVLPKTPHTYKKHQNSLVTGSPPKALKQRGASVVNVELVHMEQVEYLLSQSAAGHHHLFNNQKIKEVFKDDLTTSIPEAQVEEAKQFLHELISQPSIKAKKAYFDSLPEGVQDLVIRTYFNILENNVCKKNHRPS